MQALAREGPEGWVSENGLNLLGGKHRSAGYFMRALALRE